LDLAAEGLIPVLGGCAGVLAGGPELGLAGAAVGQVIEKAINFFGLHIVRRWAEWFREQPAESRAAALAELANLSADEARKEAGAALDRLAPDASPADRSLALEYLTAIPRTLDRALLRDPATGAWSLPPTVSFEQSHLLLQLLPTDVPPYPVPSPLPGTPYVLEQLLGSGGFGAVYRATASSLQHLPFAIKFCLDPALTEALNRERSNLERLMKAGGESWSPRIVRLYGYDLDHDTPYLVYEYVPGGDLIHHLALRRQREGRPLDADEVLSVIVQVTEALAFAHGHGLVHRDLKPANVLVDGETLKLADFGLGGVTAARAVQVSRIGATTIDFLSLAEQASLFRGAGTPLYMSPEQRRGAGPDPRHDIYSLGVMWYQLLAGDVTRELHPGWAKELALRFRVPRAHIDLIERCVGWLDERPHSAGELLPLLRDLRPAPTPAAPVESAPLTPSAKPLGTGDQLRQALLLSIVKQLHEGHEELARMSGYLKFGAKLAPDWAAGRQRQAERQIETAFETLTGEFPAVVEQWGGRAVLRNRDTVREIVRMLEATSEPQPGEADRPLTLAESLRAVLDSHAEIARRLQAKRFPFWAALILSVLAVGLPAGIGAALLYRAHFAPLSSLSRESGRYVEKYYNDHGYSLSPVQMTLTERTATATSVLVGVLAGLVLTGICTALLSWFRWPRPRLLLTLGLAALLLGLPAALGIRALYLLYFEPYHKSGNFNTPDTYTDHRGNTISQVDYELRDRREEANAELLGVCVGLALVLLAVGVSLLLYRRGQSQARRRLRGRIQKLNDAFSDAVQKWGGSAVLYKESAVREILRGVEAEQH
jgi:serine/threonine protein kinase